MSGMTVPTRGGITVANVGTAASKAVKAQDKRILSIMENAYRENRTKWGKSKLQSSTPPLRLISA